MWEDVGMLGANEWMPCMISYILVLVIVRGAIPIPMNSKLKVIESNECVHKLVHHATCT